MKPDLSDLDLIWSVERNGKVIRQGSRQGRIAGFAIGPQLRRTYTLPIGDVSAMNGISYLNLSFRTSAAQPWAEERYEVGFESLRYFGRGPVESYEDKRHASRQGLFETTVTKHFEPYVRPQENMAYTDTRWVEVATAAGQSLVALNFGLTE